MKISIICPTRLQANPHDPGELYLDRALMSATKRQSLWERDGYDWEVIVGVDPGQSGRVPERFTDGGGPVTVRVVEGGKASQASVLNACCRAAMGDVLAFIEDDDIWQRYKLQAQLPLLEKYGLVTCNQREIDPMGSFIRVNDFPTPSGWVIEREDWERFSGFDESFQFHIDTEFLGQVGTVGLPRTHIIERPGLPVGDERRMKWIGNVSRHSEILVGRLERPLVDRTVNPEGGMSRIARDPEAAAQSRREHEEMARRYGQVPW